MLPSTLAAQESQAPARMAVCYVALGTNTRQFFPNDEGKNFTFSRILRPLERFRDDMTVLSGTALKYGGGHAHGYTYLPGAPGMENQNGIKTSVSADQVVANHLGQATRIRSLQLSIRRGTGYGGQGIHTVSFNQQGIPLPPENDPDLLFNRLFGSDSEREVAARQRNFQERRSLLDFVRDEARRC
jgi:hypothetical protein